MHCCDWCLELIWKDKTNTWNLKEVEEQTPNLSCVTDEDAKDEKCPVLSQLIGEHQCKDVQLTKHFKKDTTEILPVRHSLWWKIESLSRCNPESLLSVMCVWHVQGRQVWKKLSLEFFIGQDWDNKFNIVSNLWCTSNERKRGQQKHRTRMTEN